MSGPATEPLPFAPDGVNPAPDSAPWSDTDLGLAPSSSSSSGRASLGPKPTVATDQLSTIGYIGRYALKYQIGEGGLGRVFAAHDPLLSRLIAIKTLNLEISADERESFNTLFLNEARAAGGLSHPHIVTVFDAGVSEQGPYIAMELLRGRDLRQLRLEGWRPTPTQAALLIRRVADALAYAHSKGVVHRDIKPANIFMVGRTQPRVLDFGIARVAHHHDGQENDILGGSPYYMSPEQIRHESVDRRCDVFSLGVVLYELLTDTRPFRGNSLAEITASVLEHQPPPAHEVDPNVPKALSEIAAKAMQKIPDDRYSSARSFARELRHWLDEHPQGEGRASSPASPHRQKLVWGGAATAALALAGLGWWALATQDEHNHPPLATAAPAAVLVAAASAPAVAAPTMAAPSEPLAPASQADAGAAPAGTGIVVASANTLPPAPALEADTPPASPAAAAAPPPPAPTPTTAPATVPVKAAPAVTAPAAGLTVAKAATPAAAPASAAKPPKETPKERRAREAREREAARAANVVQPVAANGVVRLAVSPWGQVEVDGKPAGIAPPLNELSLGEGRHTITIRNDEFPPFSATVNVTAGQPVHIKHRFGS